MLFEISGHNLNIGDLKKADFSLSDKVGSVILEHTTKDILSAASLLRERLGESLFLRSLESYLYSEGLCALALICEDNLKEYLKYYELAGKLGINADFFAMALGDYYCKIGEGVLAERFYQSVFKPGFDLGLNGYTASLERYLNMISAREELLGALVKGYSPQKDYGADLINTYLLLLSHIKITAEGYLGYLETAVSLARHLVKEIREHSVGESIISDTDEERDLCELLTLKLEYFVTVSDTEAARRAYDELTEEIYKSGCVRYYHARDKLFRL